MILVDTSVLIGYFRGDTGPKVSLFGEILERDIPYGISPYTYQELLQGARNEKEFSLLREYLSTQSIYKLPDTLEPFERAARIFFDLRRKGVTIRGTIDVLIALTAIENDALLLHNDRDYDRMELHIEGLRSMKTL